MSSINSIYLVFLTTGFLVGFGHCIGMCGPIVVALSLNLKDRPPVLPHLLYNTGRLTTYTLLGAIMGITASFTRFAAGIGHFQKGVMILTGIMILYMGAAMTGYLTKQLPWAGIFQNSAAISRFVKSGFNRISHHPNQWAYLPLGMLLGLLPCGPVYTAMLAAARVGMEAKGNLQGMLCGMGVMLCFGLGTVPALLLVAGLSNVKWLKHRERIYQIGAVLMMITGGYFIWEGIHY